MRAFNQNQQNYEICRGKLFGHYIQNYRHKNSDFIRSLIRDFGKIDCVSII